MKTAIIVVLSAVVLTAGIFAVTSRLGKNRAADIGQPAAVAECAPGPVARSACGEGTCTEDQRPTDHEVAGHDHNPAAHDHDGRAGHNHEADEASDLDLSVEEILARTCEHDKATYTCDACRYEVGVVRIDRALTDRPAAGGAALVTVTTVEEGPHAASIMVTGEIGLNENRRVRVRPRNAGVVRAMTVDVGDRVRKGDVLFEMESAEIGLAVREYHRTSTMVELARQRLEQERAAQGRDPSADWDLVGAQMAYEEYATELKAAEVGLRSMGFTDQDLDRALAPSATDALGRVAVRAPAGGSVIEKQVAEDEWVEPSDEAVVLADLSEVWVWAHLYEHDLGALPDGQRDGAIPVEVMTSAFPGRSFGGVIDYISPTMDEDTRTIRCRATVANQSGLLRPGMYCDVRIQVAPAREAKTIPRVGLLKDEGQTFVFTHLTEDYFVRRSVTAGREHGEAVELLAGLSAGDLVVADGAFLLKSDVLRAKMGAA